MFYTFEVPIIWLIDVWIRARFITAGVINGKAGKTAALPKFSDTLTLSQSEADYAHSLVLLHLKGITRIISMHVLKAYLSVKELVTNFQTNDLYIVLI